MLSELFFSEFLCTWKSYSHNVASVQPSLAAGDIWSVAFVKLRGISAAMREVGKTADWIEEILTVKSEELKEDEADFAGPADDSELMPPPPPELPPPPAREPPLALRPPSDPLADTSTLAWTLL